MLQSIFASSAAPGAVSTNEATIRAAVPKVVAKLGSLVLPMDSGSISCAFSGAVASLGPKSPSPVMGQSAVRWSCVELVKASAAFWRVIRGTRAVFDTDWTPRIGAPWASIKRSCAQTLARAFAY